MKNYFTLDEAASFLTERLNRKITSDAVLRIAASRESGLDLCIYFHGALEFLVENTEYGGLSSFLENRYFRGYIKIPIDAIHPDRDNFTPFDYARVIEELSNGIFTDHSAEKVLFPVIYARRIEPMDSTPEIPFHPQDAITLNILLEPQAQDPIPIKFVANRSESLIPEKSLFDFLKKNKKTEQPVILSENTKPWLKQDPLDPNPEQTWYTPARYFARQLVKDDSTLLMKRDLLTQKVVQNLTNAGFKKRGGKKAFAPSTIKKALSNVNLG